MNPAAHSGLRTAVNIETNLALHFRRGDALDFQCPVLRLGQRAAGLLFGFGFAYFVQLRIAKVNCVLLRELIST